MTSLYRSATKYSTLSTAERDALYALEELTGLEEEEESGEQGDDWGLSGDPYEGFDFYEKKSPIIQIPPNVLPSQFTEFAFRMPRPDGMGYEPFTFEGRRHMRRVYDTPAKRILLFCGRQVEKSTMLGNRILTYSCMIPAFKSLYVSPSATQAKTFSIDRVKEPLETSDILRSFTTTSLQQNIFEKQFANRAKITLRYAFLNADRCRGIPAWQLLLDELQDILGDNIPVIEQCTSHAPEEWKSYVYAGTPKSLDNIIEYYRGGTAGGRPMSTMGEWVVPCDRCGIKGGTGRYWNVLGEKNIQRKGLSCERCGNLLNPQSNDAQWAAMQTDGIFESYRIPQLMVPWRSWDEIWLDYSRYDRARFYNEVLGISYDSGLRPLTRQQVKECCRPDISMHPRELEKYKALSAAQPIFAGIDWGCHDEETRILTESGFKYFRDLTDEDKVAQWDPDTRAMSFVLPKARTVREWDKPLLHIKTRGGVDMMLTDTHRMRVGTSQGARWVTESAGELAERGGNVKFVGAVAWQGEEVPAFTLPGLPVSPGFQGADERTFAMDDWLELLGYLVSEGGLCFDGERPSCLKMSQRRPVNEVTYQKMQACLDRMNIPFTAFPNPKTGDVNWTIYGKQFWSWYAENVGRAGHEKRLPRELLRLSTRQLRILWQALMDGDGSVDARENCASGSYSSTSKGLCEDFQELSIRLGMRTVLRQHKEPEGNKKAQWRVCWSPGRDYQFNTPSSSIERVPYHGKVYCCAVPSGYIVTERNGCIAYQGNTGENSYTVLTLATYVDGRFRVFYIHRFTGEDVDPTPQLMKIDEMLSYFNVRVIGTDYGGGFHSNDHLTRKFGPKRVQKYQYASRAKKKVLYNPALRRWMAVRTEVMSDLFNALKRKQIDLPRWEEFENPHGQDCLNVFSEYNETLRAIQYGHRPDKPDDSFHSILYCLMASNLVQPRPDIFSPGREDAQRGGAIMSNYGGPVDQGLGR